MAAGDPFHMWHKFGIYLGYNSFARGPPTVSSRTDVHKKLIGLGVYVRCACVRVGWPSVLGEAENKQFLIFWAAGEF